MMMMRMSTIGMFRLFWAAFEWALFLVIDDDHDSNDNDNDDDDDDEDDGHVPAGPGGF